MNFLDKARRKVEDAINEAAANLTNSGYHPALGGYPGTQQGQYGHVPGPQYGGYAAHPPPPPPPLQWQQQQQQQQSQQQQPHQAYYGQYPAQQPGQPQQQYPYQSPSPGHVQPYQVTSPLHSQGYQSPSPAHSTPSSMSPHSGPPPSSQYFPQMPSPGQTYAPSPFPQPAQPQRPFNDPPPAYSPPLNNSNPVPPHLPPRASSVKQESTLHTRPKFPPRPASVSQPGRRFHRLSHPPAVELPAPELLPQELPATESRPTPPPEMPRPLNLPNRARASTSTTVPPPVAAAPLVKQPCLSMEGARTTVVKFHVPKTGEDFAACEHCYRFYLAPHPGMVACFEPYRGKESEFVCDLSFTRVQQIVTRQCVPDNTLDPIRDFVKLLATLTACTGDVITSPGPMWIVRDELIPSLAVCKTCFELYIRSTPFAGHFETVIHADTRDWSCDIAMPFFKRLLRSELEKPQPSFADFAEEANARIKLAPCAGYGKPIPKDLANDQHLLLRAKGGKSGRICLACYCDLLQLTPLADDWEAINLVGPEADKVPCDLGGAYSKLAMGHAVKKGDTEVWRTVVTLDGKLSPCRGAAGMDETEVVEEIEKMGEIAHWYQMTDSPSILACPRCYWLFCQLFGASHLFTRRPMMPGTMRQCAWTHSDTPDDANKDSADNFDDSSTWRGRCLRTALSASYQTGDFEQVRTVAALLAKEAPACAGKTRGFRKISGRKWFGRIRVDPAKDDDTSVIMCEECYTRTAKGRPHESLFSTDLTSQAYAQEGEIGFICQTYTNRARTHVRTAAESGDLATFAQFWNLRANLKIRREAWAPVMQQQIMKMQIYNNTVGMQTVLKFNAMGNALAMKGAAGTVDAVSGETGYRYGNSQIGHDFLSAGSAQAEQAYQDASNIQVGSPMANPAAETMRIHALFEADNQAFLAVE